MCLMRHLDEDTLIVLYDDDCGFCEVMLAMLLTWDRANRARPVSIQSTRGEELLSGMARQDHLKSWHLLDAGGMLHSGGAGIPVILDALPGGAPIASVVARFPTTTSRTYDWVANHRVLLGRGLGPRPRAWAARAIAERERSYPMSTS
jgi:predicted DCC family thiol-disulfide oxidoreductase YuxK